MFAIDPKIASDFAELFGRATDLADSGEYEVVEAVRRLAREWCAPRQIEAVELTLQGHRPAEVARRMGVTSHTVVCLLYGTPRHGKRVGGAVERLKRATRKGFDPIPEPVVVQRGLPPAWYAPALHPPDPSLFAALGLLALILHLTDAKGRASLLEIRASVPSVVLTTCLTRLRVGGYVTIEGDVVQVVRVPGAPAEEAPNEG